MSNTTTKAWCVRYPLDNEPLWLGTCRISKEVSWREAIEIREKLFGEKNTIREMEAQGYTCVRVNIMECDS